MTKNENKKKLFALALRLQKKFGVEATYGIMKRLTNEDEDSIYLLNRRKHNTPRKDVGDSIYHMLFERERKMTKRGRRTDHKATK